MNVIKGIPYIQNVNRYMGTNVIMNNMHKMATEKKIIAKNNSTLKNNLLLKIFLYLILKALSKILAERKS